MTPPNPALREYVTSGAFRIELKPSHIAAVEHIVQHRDLTFNERMTLRESQYIRRLFITASHGLDRRGLMKHRQPSNMMGNVKFGDVYELTKAGEAVAVLLAEAGMIDPTPVRILADQKGQP